MNQAEFDLEAAANVRAMDKKKRVYLWKLMQSAQKLYWEDVRSLATWAENLEKKQ